MAVFDTNNPPAQPDSDLDPDLTQEITLAITGGNVQVAPGDWVDANPSAISPDPNWGFSFQVCNVYPESEELGILVMTSEEGPVYMETTLSGSWVTNNFRRQPITT